ncbi:MAG: PTS sugar transporter subunit IIA [Anaerolineae bacterium]
MLFVSHGNLALEVLRTASLLAEVGGGAALGLLCDETPDAYARRIGEALCDLEADAGLLVLADLPGGTPYQCAVQACRAHSSGLPAAVVAPMNLAMAIEALLGRRGDAFDALLGAVERAGGALRMWRPDGSRDDA